VNSGKLGHSGEERQYPQVWSELQVSAPVAPEESLMSVAEELDKLKKMRDDGTITDEQYERAKAKLLDEGDEKAEARTDRDDEREDRRPRRRDRDKLDEDDYDDRRPRVSKKKEREWCMILHLSLFAGHIVPFGGIIAPIVIWQTKKDEIPAIDEHGKNAVNWIISVIIYALICIPLIFVIVGIPLLIILAILNIVFPIIAAVKANEGRVWRYPMSITFFK
jgi:uncharacterized Tic20 family protein